MNESISSKPVTLFAAKSIHASEQWGNSWSKWANTFEPSATFSFYANVKGKQTIKILSEGTTELNSITIEADKGFNYAEYDLTITEVGKEQLLKENTDTKVNKAKNRNYYLPKGKYTIQIGTEEIDFEIK